MNAKKNFVLVFLSLKFAMKFAETTRAVLGGGELLIFFPLCF